MEEAASVKTTQKIWGKSVLVEGERYNFENELNALSIRAKGSKNAPEVMRRFRSGRLVKKDHEKKECLFIGHKIVGINGQSKTSPNTYQFKLPFPEEHPSS